MQNNAVKIAIEQSDDFKEIQKEILKNMNLHWTTSKDAINENIVMLFHLDRANDKEKGPLFSKKVRFKIFCKRVICIIMDLINYD